jgi:hypothetical protein
MADSRKVDGKRTAPEVVLLPIELKGSFTELDVVWAHERAIECVL